MGTHYDRTTWFYEWLSKLVFGNAQIKAQEHFLHLIEPHSSILIVGGGTGQILESLTKVHPDTLQITYVEASANMIALSKKRHTGSNEVTFVHAYMEDVDPARYFDVVLTGFLFDNFTQQGAQRIFSVINGHLKPAALWIDTDFQLTGPLWQKIMLKSMYIFFKLMRAVEVMGLPDTAKLFAQYGYTLQDDKGFYGEFINSRIFKKTATSKSPPGRETFKI